MEDDDMYDDPWDDDLFMLPLADNPPELPEWFQRSHPYAASYIAANADDNPDLRETARKLSEPRNKADQERERQEAKVAFDAWAQARMAEAIASDANEPVEPSDQDDQVDWGCGNATPPSQRVSPAHPGTLSSFAAMFRPLADPEYDEEEERQVLRRIAASGRRSRRIREVQAIKPENPDWLIAQMDPDRFIPTPRPRTIYLTELLTSREPPSGLCGFINGYGYGCPDLPSVTLTVICKSCGTVHAAVCSDHFDEVLRNIPQDDDSDGELLCLADAPGQHQIVHLVEANHARR